MQLSLSQKIWIVIILAAVAGLIFFTAWAFEIIFGLIILFAAYRGIKGTIAAAGNAKLQEAAQKRRWKSSEKGQKQMAELGKRMARGGTLRRPSMNLWQYGRRRRGA